MIDTLKSWVDGLVSLWTHYTDLGCILVGALVSWCVCAIIEAYFIPETWPHRKQKGVVNLITMAVAWLAAELLWWVTDPVDPPRMRIVVTLVLCPIAPLGYVWVGRLLTKYFPAIGSVWSIDQPPKT